MTCSGCKKNKYCDKVCQSNDFKTHKIQCKRDRRFQQAVKNIPIPILVAMCTGVSLSPLALTFEQKETGQVQRSLLLEIVEAHYIMFGFGVMTVDSMGRNIFITVFLPSDIPFVKVKEKNGAVTTVTLTECLKAGNFILFFEPECIVFLNGIPAFEINDPGQFCVVFIH